MRRQQRVVDTAQGRDELVFVAARFHWENVDRGARQVTALQGFGQRVYVHHGAAGCVQQDRTRFHFRDLLGAEHHLGGRQLRHVQGDDVGLRQQFVEGAHLVGVAHGQLGDYVEKDHAHTDAFRQYRHLGADGAVADDAQGLAARLEGAFGGFHPAATVTHGVLFQNAAQHQDGLGDDQFRHTAGIRIGCVEQAGCSGFVSVLHDDSQIWARRANGRGESGLSSLRFLVSRILRGNYRKVRPGQWPLIHGPERK